jgi:DNA helicase-2/ATP-dependent DNA helicase PcrA
VFEEAMRRAGLPYNIVGGFSFYERMEVRDIIAYLKLALNPSDSIALQRVINSPPRGIGKQTLDELERRAQDYGLPPWETIDLIIKEPGNLSMRAVSALKNFRRIILRLGEMAGTDARRGDTETRGPGDDGNSASPHPSDSVSAVSDIVKAAILDTGYENWLKGEKTDEAEARLENLQELVNAAVDYDQDGIEGLREFIDHSALVSDADQYKQEAVVTLMTAHSAKGLEFPLVFIVGLEDGLFPHSRSATDPKELEEERRLCYVAMTRAQRFLYVTHAMKRRVYGEELASEPSQFLNEMPLELMEDISPGKSWLSFARGSSAIDYGDGADSHPGLYRKERKKFPGKTYDSVDSIAEFFKQRATQLGNTGGGLRSSPNASQSRRGPAATDRPAVDSSKQGSLLGSTSKRETGNSKPEPPSEFIPGSYVKHAKYGRGLVLRREGAGDTLKLTITFPGYGQKKLIQKYAGLEKA